MQVTLEVEIRNQNIIIEHHIHYGTTAGERKQTTEPYYRLYNRVKENMKEYAVKVESETALQFTLSGDSYDKKLSYGGTRTAGCLMALRHPRNDHKESNTHLAFKVKTTQPRRSLVRPNQGIVAPGSSDTITIVLVEKDKQMLLQSFDRLGQSALDHTDDMILVQSCIVDSTFAKEYLSKKCKLHYDHSPKGVKDSKDLVKSLTSMWNAASSGEDFLIYNTPLQVRYAVAPSASDTSSVKGANTRSQRAENTSWEKMTPEQMLMEISSLRHKCDELVTTTERDILK